MCTCGKSTDLVRSTFLCLRKLDDTNCTPIQSLNFTFCPRGFLRAMSKTVTSVVESFLNTTNQPLSLSGITIISSLFNQLMQLIAWPRDLDQFLVSSAGHVTKRQKHQNHLHQRIICINESFASTNHLHQRIMSRV